MIYEEKSLGCKTAHVIRFECVEVDTCAHRQR